MNFAQEPSVIAPPTPSSPSAPLTQTLQGVTALARFEFEPGRGNDGTKVIMVEWQDDNSSTRDKAGSWNVSWQGKSTVFSADDNPTDNIRRLYFLLPPGQSIPPHILIAYLPPKSSSSDNDSPEPLRMSVNPLPAIFTPELGATAKTSGKKGVLHTIWAKKRLQVLDTEIRSEQDHNLEGIALEMATAEREWIEQNFGLAPAAKKPSMTLDLSTLKPYASPPQSPGVQSPKSPGGRRLSEKLKGLSLHTSERDLKVKSVNTPTRELHPLSPEVGDMAVSSFSAFRDVPPSVSNAQTKRIVSQAPPDYIKQQQSQTPSSMFNFVPPFSQPSAQTGILSSEEEAANDDPDDLFAVALSPRSPDDPKSPFSIPSSEVSAFAKIKGSQA